MNGKTQNQTAEEEKKTISLDRYGAQDIVDAIEGLVMTEICLKNDNMPACEKYKSARITLGRNYVKFYGHSKRSMISLLGDVLLIIRGKKQEACHLRRRRHLLQAIRRRQAHSEV